MKKTKWKKPKREKYGGANWRPFVLLIGQTALAWNELHERLGSLFWTLVGSNASLSVWQSSNQDRAKRKMLKAILPDLQDAWLKDYPRLVGDIKWVLSEADGIEETRNNIIHSPLFFSQAPPGSLAAPIPYKSGVMPLAFLGNERAIKLEKKDLLTEFKWCRDAAFVLRTFTADLEHGLRVPHTWPDRPRLPNRGQKSPRPARPASRTKRLSPPPQA